MTAAGSMALQEVVCIIVLLATGASSALVLGDVTRRDVGDTFTLIGTEKEIELCSEQCAEHGAGSRSRESAEAGCACACPQRAKLFREDRELCVDDLPECSLATFGSGVGVQRIPFVYLPLKGQIIHPSREITFQGVKTPICAVSGAQYLSRKGFVDLRSSMDADVPFTLFRDEGRTFLQWSGEDELRKQMSGRVVVVRLLCRDVDAKPSTPIDLRGVFTPCVAFRLQGSSIRHSNNVTEVLFASNAHTFELTSNSGLSTGEYVAIGISSLLLGLIYVASVFLYLHIKKRRKSLADSNSTRKLRNVKKFDGSSITDRDIIRIHNERVQSVGQLDGDKGVVKKNPLLSIGRHFHQDTKLFSSDSASNVSDSDDFTDSPVRSEDNRHTAKTSAVIHSVHKNQRIRDEVLTESAHRDESGIERLPDEHVSIVETPDDREIARPVGTTRRKLYFNPAYFEPQLMAEPPPAALEFLVKIREVIAIAKHKMAAKRFQPVLNEIPEEDSFASNANSIDMYHAMGSRSESIVSLKRENSRKKSCVGCPGCKSVGSDDLQNFIKYEYPACANCLLNRGEKQNSIRQWLENIPTVKLQPYIETGSMDSQTVSGSIQSNRNKVKKQHSFTLSSQLMRMSDDFSFPKKTTTLSVRSEPPIRSYNLPLPDFENHDRQHNNFMYHGKTISSTNDIRPVGFNSERNSISLHRNSLGNIRKNKFITHKNALPDMVSEAIALENCSKAYAPNSSDEERFYNKSTSPESNHVVMDKNDCSPNDCEVDSLERVSRKKAMSTPADSDVTSSQASPSLSNALPLEEELTMRNAIYKTMSSSNSNTPSPLGDTNQNHYETIGKSQGKRQKFKSKTIDGTRNNDYSLVSEVYVNNSYDFDSPPASPTASEESTISRKLNNPNATILENHGCLTIEVKDSPENYIQIHESDGFDPDTLDRKQLKHKDTADKGQFSRKGFIDSLSIHQTKNSRAELHSSDTYRKTVKENLKNFNSYRKDVVNQPCSEEESARSSTSPDIKYQTSSNTTSGNKKCEIWKEIPPDWETEEGRILTLEMRHSKRQRQCTPPTIKQIKTLARPDILPPLPPTEQHIYEHPPFPARKVENESNCAEINSKNDYGRSRSPRTFRNQNTTENLERQRKTSAGSTIGQSRASVRSLPSDNDILYYPNGDLKKNDIGKIPNRRRFLKASSSNPINTNTFVKSHKDEGHKFRYRRKKASSIEDSGYLSSDSASSRKFPRKLVVAKIVSSESEDSEHEAQSESGAESVETHSVFYGSFRNTPGNPTFNSVSRNFELTGKKHPQKF